jgi:eukaryotic-like serine/threonine-protein kinase
MDLEQLRRVKALFDSVVDLPTADRSAVIARDSAGDAVVRREVNALLRIADSNDFLTDDLRTTSLETNDDSMVGANLGAYKLIRVVGTGGMGTVFEATRDDAQFNKRVAVKLVQRGGASDLLVARFRLERQILARLEHRNIATLLDGGVTPDGRPYLVMEFVDGAPITHWSDAQRLSIRERLALFRQVCAAVQFAHANLIIHRDLKPANIFVTGDGTVKLLDFGIAKLLGAPEDDAAPITRAGSRALTPEYASPEQMRGDVLSTASDIYSLGVVLFELLCGVRPYTGTAAVFIEEPPAPSVALKGSAVASRGDGDVARARRSLRGDVDQIVLTLLRKEPERRYSSAEALADDLRRHLEGLPVRAQADRLQYRLGKFVRRNRVAVTAVSAVLISLVGGAIATSRAATRATIAQKRAERVSGFLQTVLSTMPASTSGRDLPISEVLDSASRRLPTELADEPRVRGELEGTIGNAYRSLGKYDVAESHLLAAWQLATVSAGASSREAISALNELAGLELSRGQPQRADTMLHKALTLAEGNGSRDDELRARLMAGLGSVAHYKGDAATALEYHAQALAIRQRVLPSTDDAVATSMVDVAVSLGELNRWAESEGYNRRAVAIFEANHPGPNTLVAESLNALATALDLQGKVEAADSAYRKVLALRKQLYGRKHPDYAFTVMNYAMFNFDRGKFVEAAALVSETLALRGNELPESHPAIATSLQTLGRSLDRTGDHAGAERALRESLGLRQRYLPAGSWLIGSSEGVLGEHYLDVKEYPRAERYLRHGDSLMVAAFGDASPRTQANLKRLLRLYTETNDQREVASVKARLAQK